MITPKTQMVYKGVMPNTLKVMPRDFELLICSYCKGMFAIKRKHLKMCDACYCSYCDSYISLK